jgi:hypothetical protein
MAATGFTLQIYFDFSGYSDMALGAARVFGIRLPMNFDSPLKAPSIIDFWMRWHMTLTRFLTAYFYNPLVLSLTRRRLAKGYGAGRGQNMTIGSFVSLLMLPTILTMFISGLWHGAGYSFVFWGLLHGFYLTINHGWRVFRRRLIRDWHIPMRISRFAEWGLTFVAVATAMVFFRSPTMNSAFNIVKGMVGLNGVGLPATLFRDYLGAVGGWLQGAGIASESWMSLMDFGMMTTWTATLIFIALLCPNTLQILSQYEPALGVKPRPETKTDSVSIPAWNPSLAWAGFVAVAVAIGIFFLSRPSEFLYWQF